MSGWASLAWRWAWVAVLATWLILAHGCHAGDHDDELVITWPDDRATR
jgi:hypothetical protein